MFFPFKIVRRREMYGDSWNTSTYYTLTAFWRSWQFVYTRPNKKTDKMSHFIKEFM